MKNFTLAFAILSCVSLVGCGKDTDGDTAGEGEGQSDLVLPQAGDWTVLTTGFTDDDCGASDWLLPQDSATFSDVDGSSFSMTLYYQNERIGEGSVRCSHTSDNSYTCEDMYHSTPWSGTTTVSMVAKGTVNMISETSVSAAGELVIDCSGNDCNQVASTTATGSFPCNTTLNWTAAPN